MEDRTEPQTRRPVTSGALAMGLVVAAVFVWWLLSGQGPQGPAGSESRYAAADDTLATTTPAGETSFEPTSPDGVRIDSYVAQDALRIGLNYRFEPDCVLQRPRIFETSAAVSITLTASPGEPSVRCGERSPGEEQHTVVVLLSSPLDGRSILDASVAPHVRVEPVAATYE
jgi:hypothetical protein